MKITITKTLEISEANAGLLQVVAFDKGYVEGDVQEYVKGFLAHIEKVRLVMEIEPSLRSYFGGIMKAQGEEVINQLQEAVNVVVTIE